MVQKKRKDHRSSLLKGMKIKKKAAEKRRKDKKLNKNKPQRKQRDPGIPNNWPEKPDILQTIKNNKNTDKISSEKPSNTIEDVYIDNRPSYEKLADIVNKKNSIYEMEHAQDLFNEMPQQESICNLQKEILKDRNWTQYFKNFKQLLHESDVLLEILDCRDPLTTRCKNVEQRVISQGKKIIIVLNKIDMVPLSIAKKWESLFANEYPTVLLKSATLIKDHNKIQRHKISEDDTFFGKDAYNIDKLIKTIKDVGRNSGITAGCIVGVFGYPNVGKSSIINSLKGSSVCSTGNTPGITKLNQYVQIDKWIKLIDSPGIMFHPSVSSGSLGLSNEKKLTSTNFLNVSAEDVILRNCVPVQSIEDPIHIVKYLINRCDFDSLAEYYEIPSFNDSDLFLIELAKKRALHNRGGSYNINSAAMIVLNDWYSNRISYYVSPPDSLVDSMGPKKSQPRLVEIVKNDFNPSPSLDIPEADTDQIFINHMEDMIENESNMQQDVPENKFEIVQKKKPIVQSAEKTDILETACIDMNQQHNKDLKKSIKKARKASVKKINKKLGTANTGADHEMNVDETNGFDTFDEELI